MVTVISMKLQLANETLETNNDLGRLDYVQFIKGAPVSKEISPKRSRQPMNMRLFQTQARRLLKDSMEQIMKAKVLGRALSIERTKIAMNCGKTESMDNYCGLSECNICEIDQAVENLDEKLTNFCSPRRNYSAFEEALIKADQCCDIASKEPVLLVTHEKWPISVSKILMEATRITLETYATTGKTDPECIQRMHRNLDFVYGKKNVIIIEKFQ